MADEPKTPEELEQFEKSLNEYRKKIREILEIEEEARLEQKKFFDAMLEDNIGYIENRKELQRELSLLEANIVQEQRELQEAIKLNDKERQKQAENEIEIARSQIRVLEELKKTSKDLNDESEELVKSQKKRLGSFLGFLDQFNTELAKSMAKTVAAMRLLGLEFPSFYENAQDSLLKFDTARRSFVPFTRSLSDTSVLMEELKNRMMASNVPITELSESAKRAAEDFRLFGQQPAMVQGEIATLASQLDKLGFAGGVSLLESIMTEGGVNDAKKAGDLIKGITMQMKELGVTPAKVSAGLSSLMGSYAMFGESATTNIAKAVFAAEKMRIDTGTLTSFGDQFANFTGAAKAKARINAVFGMNIIDNPAELVTAYFTGGDAAVAMLIKQKIQESGIDMEQFFEGPAGAAKAMSLGAPLGLGNAQNAIRFFTSDMTAADLEGVGEGTTTKGFQETVDAMRTIPEQIELVSEKLAISLMDGMNLSFQNLGPVFDKLLQDSAKGSIAAISEFFQLKPVKEGLKGIAEVLPTGPSQAKQPETLEGILSSTSENKEETKKLREELTKNTEAVDKLSTQLSNLDGESFGKSPAFGFGTNRELSLKLDPSCKQATLSLLDNGFKR